MPRLIVSIGAIACLAFSAMGALAPLQTFTVKDYLQHAWSNELVHFPISHRALSTPKSLTLTDAAGQSVPCQVTGLGRSGWTVTGTVWTVVSVPPKGEVVLQLREDIAAARRRPTPWRPARAAG